jgi:hypothetical protein
VQPDAAVDDVHQQRREQDHDQNREEPGQRRGDERKLEHVEGDVDTEGGVALAEVDPVPKQQPLVPVGGQAGPEHHRQHHRQGQADMSRS